ncbi:MAG: type II toxin-antitoxin system VapC family toxin [Verrucomicrobiales bacterium]|nr:type II toxin-antitoxin system VapC family toxin [Verrucomicrobiales bacterium]
MSRSGKIVVDASVVLAVILNEPEKPGILAATENANLISPKCLQWEIGNAFSAMIKQGRLTLELALRGIEIYDLIPIQQMGLSLLEAIVLSERHNIYAYDAYYLQLAKRNAAPILTLDRRMAAVADIEGIQNEKIR